MSNSIINLIVNVFLMIVAIVPILNIIYNKNIEGKIWKKIGWRGWVIMGCVIGIVAFNFVRDFNQDRKQKLSDSLVEKTQSELMEIKSKLDVTNPQLKIRSLSKGKHAPAFIKEDGEFKGFNIQFESSDGTSYNVLLKGYFYIYNYNNYYTFLDSCMITFGHAFITKDVISTKHVDLADEVLGYSRVLVVILGSFSKDPLGEHIIPYSEAFLYNFKEKEWIGKFDGDIDKIKDHIKSNNR